LAETISIPPKFIIGETLKLVGVLTPFRISAEKAIKLSLRRRAILATDPPFVVFSGELIEFEPI
jgi:hypothetical protein